MKSYAWTITKDHIDEGRSVGVVGPSNALLTKEEIIAAPNGKKFRMLDGDGELYYEGVLVDETGDCDEFEPLDDFGSPNAGCTEIQYWQPGEGGGWKPL